MNAYCFTYMLLNVRHKVAVFLPALARTQCADSYLFCLSADQRLKPSRVRVLNSSLKPFKRISPLRVDQLIVRLNWNTGTRGDMSSTVEFSIRVKRFEGRGSSELIFGPRQ